MSTKSLRDPRSGRDRRVPTRTHAFESGTLDPISTNKRPLFTIGNGILLVLIIGYGMYATGRLPQLDAFFDHADQYGKSHNSTVVNTFITYGSMLFFALIALLVGLIVFSFINGYRRNLTERRVDEIEERRERQRRIAASKMTPREDLPSLVMPLGKEAPARQSNNPKPLTPQIPVMAVAIETPAAALTTLSEEQAPAAVSPLIPTAEVFEAIAAPVVATSPKPTPAPSIFDIPDSGKTKAAAMASAAQAEEAAANAPLDLMPSFVPMPGKERIRAAVATPVARVLETAQAAAPTVEAAVEETPKPIEAPTVAEPVVIAVAPAASAPKPATDTSVGSAPTDVFAEAALAAARATLLQAEATIAAAKAEATIAQAKAEVAIAEAVAAAAKAKAKAATLSN